MCAAAPLLTAAAFSLFAKNPLVPLITNRELTAFWIGAATVGAAWVVFYLLRFDATQNLRGAAEAERWTAHETAPSPQAGMGDTH